MLKDAPPPPYSAHASDPLIPLQDSAKTHLESGQAPGSFLLQNSAKEHSSATQTPQQNDRPAKTWLESWMSWDEHRLGLLKRQACPQSREELAARKAERKAERVAARKVTRDAAEKAKQHAASRKAERVAAEKAKRHAAQKSVKGALPQPEVRKQKIRDWYGHQYDYAPGRRQWYGSQYDYE
ncbi:hypothetical protein LTR91_004226 [Friedmanniomyces endolithicus]|uniref:Uncharacterized protein n=1 Tax=Friedmanniomyces endolithicus TaxID=329885 RepID=A0AAN6QYS9_9PEZI|nr:hypothetical protein LTR94_009993 [Friedmanniomyces endolithicus]KAK0794364.1 hypothetical protein LTR75_010879 [Friedmanniomyces endolithicus]KAK0795361.1 hypothetical protein LTR59_007472 [Friedmanniomyces endolithicus]KAK0801687.1 hypothetical protein LTR38_006728 [Friedmanniomyces endolithicus]KAK0847914.1 hypothetical protein LTR03_006040 [Friedmanniomyces endolithicus]